MIASIDVDFFMLAYIEGAVMLVILLVILLVGLRRRVRR